jgi:hypothetical protein
MAITQTREVRAPVATALVREDARRRVLRALVPAHGPPLLASAMFM